MDVKTLREKNPEIAQMLIDEGHAVGHATGLIAGAEAERARIRGVEAQLMPGHEQLIATLKFDGRTTGAEAAIQVLAAERAALDKRSGALAGDAPKPVPHTAAPKDVVATDESRPLEERCKAKWDANAQLRAEFGGEFKAFLAYEKAHSEGRVRVLGSKRAA